MRRRRNENPLSLFSFQDIITSVTGILILLAIMLAIAVIRQRDSTETVDQSPPTEELKAEVEALESSNARLEQIVAERQSQLMRWTGRTMEELKTEQASLIATKAETEKTLSNTQAIVQEARQTLTSAQNDPKVKAAEAAFSDAEAKLAELREKIKQLQSGTRVVYNFRSTSARPWLVEISNSRVAVGRAGEKTQPQQLKSVEQFKSFVDSLDASDRYFVLVVKPSGIDNFDRIRAELMDRGADVGVELLAEDQVALDPDSGAVFQ